MQVAGSSTLLPYSNNVANAFGEAYYFPTSVIQPGFHARLHADRSTPRSLHRAAGEVGRVPRDVLAPHNKRSGRGQPDRESPNPPFARGARRFAHAKSDLEPHAAQVALVAEGTSRNSTRSGEMESDQANRLRIAAHIALVLAGAVAFFWGLYVAQSVFAPTVLAFVFGVVLSPLSDFWERLGLKRGLSALLSLVLTLFLIVLIAGLALPVADRLIEAWPTILRETRALIFDFQAMLQGLESAGEEVRQAVSGSGENTGSSEGGSIAIPTTADALFLAPSVLGQTITFAGVLFFFLLTRNEVYAWVAQHVAPEHLETQTAHRLKQAEREVARYFLTISVVNAGFGICTSIAMVLLGVPSPLLWGAAVFVLNFILYLGPALVFAGLLLTGLIVFDGSYSFVPALVFLGLNLIEAQFVTPSAIGRTMQVNPLLIFFSLVFFLWLWGPLGGFVAIPMLLWALSLTEELSATRKEVRDAVRLATEEQQG